MALANRPRDDISRLPAAREDEPSFMPLAIAVLSGAAVSGFPKTRWINQLSSNREETMKNLYVGNLEKTTTEEDLETAFAIYGSVELVSIIRDQTTGLPREFGFMEMT